MLLITTFKKIKNLTCFQLNFVELVKYVVKDIKTAVISNKQLLVFLQNPDSKSNIQTFPVLFPEKSMFMFIG